MRIWLKFSLGNILDVLSIVSILTLVNFETYLVSKITVYGQRLYMFCTLVYLICQAQCLAHSRCSVKICAMNKYHQGIQNCIKGRQQELLGVLSYVRGQICLVRLFYINKLKGYSPLHDLISQNHAKHLLPVLSVTNFQVERFTQVNNSSLAVKITDMQSPGVCIHCRGMQS